MLHGYLKYGPATIYDNGQLTFSCVCMEGMPYYHLMDGVLQNLTHSQLVASTT
jgi:hypothetical protein